MGTLTQAYTNIQAHTNAHTTHKTHPRKHILTHGHAGDGASIFLTACGDVGVTIAAMRRPAERGVVIVYHALKQLNLMCEINNG